MLTHIATKREDSNQYVDQTRQSFAQFVKQIDTIVIGGGQAGLAISYYLTQQGREHLVLEKSHQIGTTWRKRWDSFSLVTPNWQLQLPGFGYKGERPDGFLKREEIVSYLEQYAAEFNPPIKFGTTVKAIEPLGDGRGYTVQTKSTMYQANNVIIATGTFQQPNILPASKNLPKHITQLHSGDYRNAQALPQGAVLVVGSGQSGSQIAQELNENGRKVYLATGTAGRLPRRYRGHDSLWWGNQIGMFDKTVDKLESTKERFAANPQLSGKDGGRDLNLHEFARDGIVLLGRLQDIQGNKLSITPNLKENLRIIDDNVATFKQNVDKFIESTGMNVPAAQRLPEMQDGYVQKTITELDITEAGITTIIWATGYRWDYSWIRLPIFDEDGYPIQAQGITSAPGLYFVGLFWMNKLKSGLFFGVGEDAAHVANHLQQTRPQIAAMPMMA